MDTSVKSDVSQEALSLVAKLRRNTSWREYLNMVFYCGASLLLIRKLDFYLVLWYFVFKLTSTYFHQQKQKNLLLYQTQKSGAENAEQIVAKKIGKTGLLGIWLITGLVQLLILYWIFSLLGNPATKAKGAIWLLVISILQLVALVIAYLVNRRTRDLLKGSFLPVNVILWQLFSLGRPELKLLFWAEGLYFFFLAAHDARHYDPEKDLPKQRGKWRNLSDLSSLIGLKDQAEMDKMSKEEKLVYLKKLNKQGIISDLVVSDNGTEIKVSFTDKDDKESRKAFSVDATTASGVVTLSDDDDEEDDEDKG